MTTASSRPVLVLLALVGIVTAAACSTPAPPPPAKPSGDAAFNEIARAYLEDTYRRQPTFATLLGIHQYDQTIRDPSRKAVVDEIAAARQFRERAAAIDASTLSPSNQLDHQQLLLAIDSRILTLDVVRPWARDPDSYSSGLTNTAYLMIKRAFAPPEERLRHLIARERAMPATLAEARKNLENPPRIYTEIAIEQIDGNRDFFKTAVASAFPTVTDKALLAEFKQVNDAVIAALDDYKKWLKDDLIKRSAGEFAIGEDTYRKKLAADEMITLSLDDLLAIAEKDLRKNQAAFAETARLIDPKRTPMQVLEKVQADYPPASKLLSTTQGELDALGRFMSDHHLITIPKAAPAVVQETPPFLRATTSASMEIPGPFEKVATEAYYNMTLPDPKTSAKEQHEFMRQWYYAAISNVSVHEVWPGHYLQFLYAKSFPSDVRKVLGTSSNSEGWAHYCEQMVIDEGFHRTTPAIASRRSRTRSSATPASSSASGCTREGMTREQAEDYFVKEGYQPRPVAVSESKRGTSDPTYGYYTMGKLMILKLREDYKAKIGRSVLPTGVPRHIHRSGTAAAAAHPEGDAGRSRTALLNRGATFVTS